MSPQITRPARAPRAAAAATLLACAGSALGQPAFEPLGDLPGGPHFSQALGVSGDGSVVVGLATVSQGQRPFRWTHAGGMESLSLLAGTNSGRANAVSTDGTTVVGRSGDRSVRWPGPNPLDLNTFNAGMFSSANGCSADGETVVGNAYDGNLDTTPYRWTSAGGTQNLGPGIVTFGSFEAWGALDASANGSVIVGNEGFSTTYAFSWTLAGGLVNLAFLPFGPLTPASSASACSDDGSIIVGRCISLEGMQACRWTPAGVIGLADLPGGAYDSEALATSADGSVVVGRGTTDAGAEAFMWSASTGLRSLAVHAASLGVTGMAGWTLRTATGVSSNGRVIVGWGMNPTGETEAWVLRLPESAPCYANCDGSTENPILNVADFACFRAHFLSGDSYANCDGSTLAPAINVADFFCFLNHFARGCP